LTVIENARPPSNVVHAAFEPAPSVLTLKTNHVLMVRPASGVALFATIAKSSGLAVGAAADLRQFNYPAEFGPLHGSGFRRIASE
jgi:hypothetical protein